MSEHNFQYIDINSELRRNRVARRATVIAFHKQELLDAYDTSAPQAQIDGHRQRLAIHLGIASLSEPGEDAIAA